MIIDHDRLLVKQIRHVRLTGEVHATCYNCKATYPGPDFPLRVSKPFSFVDWRVWSWSAGGSFTAH